MPLGEIFIGLAVYTWQKAVQGSSNRRPSGGCVTQDNLNVQSDYEPGYAGSYYDPADDCW